MTVEINAKLSANSSRVLLDAAIAGLGIARLPNYVVHQALVQQQLNVILEDFYPPPIPVYAIYTQSRIIPPKVRAFVHFIQKIHLVID